MRGNDGSNENEWIPSLPLCLSQLFSHCAIDSHASSPVPGDWLLR